MTTAVLIVSDHYCCDRRGPLLQEKRKAEEKLAKDAGKRQQQQETNAGGDEKDAEPMEAEKTEIAGSKVLTLGAERPPESTIHTQLEHLHLGSSVSEGQAPRVLTKMLVHP